MRLLYNLVISIIIIFSPMNKIKKEREETERLSKLIEKQKFEVTLEKRLQEEREKVFAEREKLEKQKDIKNILLSTSTLSSSKIFNKFKFKKTIHQFYPIDNPLIINKFLDHWKPSSVFFVESEIWPEMLRILKPRKIKIFLLNARISKKSFAKWKNLKKIGIKIFNMFDYFFPQNKLTFNYLRFFNVKNIKILGNLKFSETEKLESYKSLSQVFKKRKIICAASTHNNEEEIISDIHLSLRKNIKNLLTVIIPRHIERSNTILQNLKEKKINYICHSENKKLRKDIEVYLVDTYGDSKAFYSISKVVFLGGSFVPRGGQNPLEPLRYGCNIVHGKHIYNFTEIYNMLHKSRLSFKAKNFSELKKIISNLLIKEQNNKIKVNKFKKIGKNILAKNFKEIRALI